MTITLNGMPFELVEPVSLAELLRLLGADPRQAAVTHNHQVVRRAGLATAMVCAGDRVEVVRMTAGG